MFVRKKRNNSGSISIQIISKKNKKYKLVETIGCSKNQSEIEELIKIANDRLLELEPNLFDFMEYQSKKQKLTNKDMRIIGDELIFGKIFKDIGCSNIIFKNIKDKEIFKALIISRLLYPGSKLYLIDYYHIYKKQKIDKNKIYRFLDTIYKDNLKLQIEKCVFNFTKKRMNNTITVTFYDVTTLYFESESEDDLRRIGFSKEGKIARPQIQLGLFTTLEGYPLSFEVYEGNKYEGHTLIDILKKFQDKFNLENKPIVVADRGMLNNDNLAYLENNGYKYILAAKIKNSSDELKEKISNLSFLNDKTIHTLNLDKEIKYEDENNKNKTIQTKQRLILAHSSKRAKKDKYNREKALQRLEKKLSKNITKSDLKLSYYGKYLDIDEKCDVKYKLNTEKILKEEKLDGIKGFITNDFNLKAGEVIEHYKNQYDVEKAFRISKTDLKIRPIYHRLDTRIKVHILISFVSYAVYKEFERKIKKSNLDIKFKLTQDIIWS
ncbi:MAG: IS1634 family transposase [Arcobacter sp.]|nr:IS1634 family transposase [Arcobacter sp.]